METALCLLSAVLFIFFAHSSAFLATAASASLRGVHPFDEKYYLESELIDCNDKSNSFTIDRLNDDFCDCVDGSDEPGTSACPSGRFYCRNMGSTPQFLFSSHVNDHICDCCDGSDEYDGSIYCPNTCIMGGDLEYKSETHHYTRLNSLHEDAVNAKRSKSSKKLKDIIESTKKLEDLIVNVEGLKVVLLVQWVLVAMLVALCVFHQYYRRNKSRRRRYH